MPVDQENPSFDWNRTYNCLFTTQATVKLHYTYDPWIILGMFHCRSSWFSFLWKSDINNIMNETPIKALYYCYVMETYFPRLSQIYSYFVSFNLSLFFLSTSNYQHYFKDSFTASSALEPQLKTPCKHFQTKKWDDHDFHFLRIWVNSSSVRVNMVYTACETNFIMVKSLPVCNKVSRIQSSESSNYTPLLGVSVCPAKRNQLRKIIPADRYHKDYSSWSEISLIRFRRDSLFALLRTIKQHLTLSIKHLRRRNIYPQELSDRFFTGCLWATSQWSTNVGR